MAGRQQWRIRTRLHFFSLKMQVFRSNSFRPKRLVSRWPQINYDKIEWGIYEPQSGYVFARASAQAVAEEFIAEGGQYRQAEVPSNQKDTSPSTGSWLEDGNWKALPLSDGSQLVADRYIFACGPWLGKLFPHTIGPHLVATKQDVFFFGTPANDPRYNENEHSRMGRSWRALHVRHPRKSGPRFQDCRRHPRPRLRPNFRRKISEPRSACKCPTLHGLSVSGNEGRAAGRDPCLPI